MSEFWHGYRATVIYIAVVSTVTLGVVIWDLVT